MTATEQQEAWEKTVRPPRGTKHENLPFYPPTAAGKAWLAIAMPLRGFVYKLVLFERNQETHDRQACPLGKDLAGTDSRGVNPYFSL